MMAVFIRLVICAYKKMQEHSIADGNDVTRQVSVRHEFAESVIMNTFGDMYGNSDKRIYSP